MYEEHMQPDIMNDFLPVSDECEDSSDCSDHGMCIDIKSTNAPTKQCFCFPGYHGPLCEFRKTSILTAHIYYVHTLCVYKHNIYYIYDIFCNFHIIFYASFGRDLVNYKHCKIIYQIFEQNFPLGKIPVA